MYNVQNVQCTKCTEIFKDIETENLLSSIFY